MRRTHQIHAIAIAVIVGVVLILYALIGPKPTPAPGQPVKGDRFITIASATWGENCNRYIADAIRERQAAPLPKDEKGVVIPQPALAAVTMDNVLSTLGNKCNGQLTCAVDVNSINLGTEPLSSCFKRLKVSYRCYSYDRLWNKDLGQGDLLNIDCNNAPAAPAAH